MDADTLPAGDWARPGRGVVVDNALDGGQAVRVLSYWSMLACKIAAFEDPRREAARDPHESTDFHDIVLLLAGNEAFAKWMCRPEPALSFVAAWCAGHDPDRFRLTAYPHIPHDGADKHLDRIGTRIRALAALAIK